MSKEGLRADRLDPTRQSIRRKVSIDQGSAAREMERIPQRAVASISTWQRSPLGDSALF